MKIALVSIDQTPLVAGEGQKATGRGGRLAAIACELAAAGHEAHIFTRRSDLWSLPVVPLAPHAHVVHLPAGPPYEVPHGRLPALMDDFAARFIGACSADGYDVVHAACPLSALAALRLRGRCGVPFVVACDEHTSTFADRVATLADRVVAFDPEERDRLLARCGGTARIEIVPIGIDTTAFAPSSRSARARFGLRAEEFAIVLRARPERRAGIDTAVGALAALRRDHGVAARLLVAAATDDFDTAARAEIARLRKLAVAAGVSGQVTFVPAASTTALREVYAAADAAVVLPEGPCEPATALEAMACGIPVVGADRGSLRWAMQDEVTGFLVPGGDAAAVAERLARLRRNPELGRAYGRAGIRRVRAGFTWRHAAGALAWIYAGVLAPHRARLAAAASR